MKRLLMTAALCAATASLAAPVSAATFSTLSGAAPIIIAHRGASGYLPEHTLAGYELAAKMGAAYIEPDLQFTKDGELVAIHDTTLTRTTNVKDLFAPRNGGYAVGDFTLAEIKTLTVKPVGTSSTSYPGFTPSSATPFSVPTFKEVLDFVNGYNTANGTKIGVYPEAKSPTSNAMNQRIVEQLKSAGFTKPTDKAYIQSFDFAALKDIQSIEDTLGVDLPEVALGAAVVRGGVFSIYDYASRRAIALTEVARFADGLGVSLRSSGLSAEFIRAAHDLGLVVHGWTFNQGDYDLAKPQFQKYIDMGMDGFFANFPDVGLRIVNDNVAPVPLPAALPMLVVALGGLTLLRRRTA